MSLIRLNDYIMYTDCDNCLFNKINPPWAHNNDNIHWSNGGLYIIDWVRGFNLWSLTHYVMGFPGVIDQVDHFDTRGQVLKQSFRSIYHDISHDDIPSTESGIW